MCELPLSEQPARLHQLQTQLAERRQEFPGLVQYSELITDSPSTAAIMATGLRRESIDFFRRDLVPFPKRLRGVRGEAMHDPLTRVDEDQVGELLAQAMGLGVPGMLLRVALALETEEPRPGTRKGEKR